MADEDLALLDWVVASVHQAPDNRGRPSACSRRCRTRTSTAIGHLTGRRIGKRPPRDVDVERVIEGALETGTLLEINGQPDRLDLRDVHARAAKEAGLKLIASLRRARGSLAGLRRAGGCAGPARLADEGRRRQHAHLEAARQAAEEAAVTDFREDGVAALEWTARYSSGSASSRCSRRSAPTAPRCACTRRDARPRLAIAQVRNGHLSVTDTETRPKGRYGRSAAREIPRRRPSRTCPGN